MSKKELQTAPAETKALAAMDYGDNAAKGFDNQTREDVTVPFLGLLQGLSPQLETLEGAKPGLLFNTVTNELYKDGVVIVPALTQHVFVEWKPRSQGGGFVAVHALDSPIVRAARETMEFGKYAHGENELNETFYIYGVQLDSAHNPVGPITIAFTSTKIKSYKRWSAATSMFLLPADALGRRPRPPMFAHRVKVTSTKEKNIHGEFHNYVLTPAEGGSILQSLLPPDSAAFLAGAECYEMFAKGMASIDYSKQSERGGASEDAGGKPVF